MHLLCGLVFTWCAQAVRPLCQVRRVKQSEGVRLQSDGAGVQSDGVRLQSDGVRLQSEGVRLQSDGAGVQSEGAGVQTLEVTVPRGERRLGMMLDDANVVLEIKPNSPARGLLQAGDQVLALDSVELAGRRLAQVLQPRPTHIFKVCRHVKC
jgi:hypothetical protein